MDVIWGSPNELRSLLQRMGAFQTAGNTITGILNSTAEEIQKKRSDKTHIFRCILNGFSEILNLKFHSIRNIGEELLRFYSVYDAGAISQFYDAVVAQYPLDVIVTDRMLHDISTLYFPQFFISEDGPGTGVFPERLIASLRETGKPFVYDIIEPNVTFCSLINSRNLPVNTFDATGESWVSSQRYNVKVVRYTYHHYFDKILALKNHFTNLQPGGLLFIPEVCFREYAYDIDFKPTDSLEFVRCDIQYAAALIASMPAPSLEVIIDQVITAMLDILRVEELKTCESILLTLLERVGFKIITRKNLSNDPDIIWAYIVAQKP